MTSVIDKLEMQILSDPVNIIRIEPFIEKVRAHFTASDDIFGNMLVAITEAVNNAISHGNECDPSKLVYISAQRSGNTISYIIEDQGVGFDYNNLPDPTAPENIEKPTGRGVFLMKELSDLVLFSDKGRVVEIHFKL